MRRCGFPAAVLALRLGVAQASSSRQRPDLGPKFKRCVGTVAPYTGPTNAIRGVPGLARCGARTIGDGT